MVKKFYFFFLIVFTAFHSLAQPTCELAQPRTIDTVLSCSQTCVSLQLKIPDIKNTTTYDLISSQYLPYPYQCPSDTNLTTLYIDDWFSQAITLPFNFCFYGQNYNKVVIGSNGVITFDVSNANCANSYTIPINTPIPSAGGTQCSQSAKYYPRASIMGAYYDIDPSIASTSPRISYYFTGLAPNRKMVVVYNQVPVYGSACNRLLASQEIILYESTGIIDVHIGNKPLCTSSTSAGRAILGIQNWNQDQAVAAPGKNCTQWSASNETYRFIPAGVGASLFRKVELFRGNVLIDTGTVVPDGAGQLQASFTSTCFTTDTATYRAVATYASCADPNMLVTYETQIRVSHNGNLPVAASFAPASCSSGGIGIVTVTNPVGSTYEYSIDTGRTYQTSPVFNIPGGTYSIRARNTQTGCVGTTLVTVPVIETVRFATGVSNATCFGVPNGQILVATQSGAQPFQFSADSGVTYQGTNLLLVGAGRHVVRVKDNNGCTKDTVVIVNQPDSISISQRVAAAFCSGTADGKIMVSASGGTPRYRYALINTPASYQPDSTLNANVGNFTVYVKDANNCVDSSTNITVPLNDTMRLTPQPDTVLCLGSSIVLGPNTNATQFAWGPAGFISDTTLHYPTFSPQDTGTFYLTAKLGTLCSRTDTFDINVLKRPIPNAGNDTTICFGTYAYLNATAIRGNKYRWSPAAYLSNANIPNPRATGYVPITYVVEVTDPYGCGFKNYDTVKLTVRPKVRAYAGQDTTATLGLPVQLFGCCMDIYQWEPATVFENDTARNPIGHFPPGNTQIIMTTTTPEGCEGRDTVLVKGYVGPTYYVPSGFTPNGDGRNDVLRPIPVGIVETYYFSVYNRYGQMLYTTKTFMEGWDGRWKGELQPEAAYIWMVRGKGIDGKIVEQKGTVVLMK